MQVTSLGEVLFPTFPLRTERLQLRPYGPDDFDFLLSLESDPALLRFISWGPRSEEQVRVSLAQKLEQTSLRAEGDELTLVMVLDEIGERVGDVQLTWTSREHRQGEVGFITHPEHAGHGYATEGAELLLRLGFGELGLHRITASLDARNTASARAAMRLGMTQEACLRQNAFCKGEWTDEVIYAVRADEWRAARRS